MNRIKLLIAGLLNVEDLNWDNAREVVFTSKVWNKPLKFVKRLSLYCVFRIVPEFQRNYSQVLPPPKIGSSRKKEGVKYNDDRQKVE